MLAEDFRKRHETERVFGHALIGRASEKSKLIRLRLAVVAQELRQAAAMAGSESEDLLKLANKFEENSKPTERTLIG